ncbi:hypothetical protein BBJ28_00023504 [Nothophytophthora sp. Chile5]|nr:hypothetical protein BBJ28_00023504 [Nothophytophthora sp. Chile5]
MQWSRWLPGPGRASNKRLGYFAIYCWKYGWNRARIGNGYATIQLKLASIRWYHRRHLGLDLTSSPDFTILLKGIRRLSDPVQKKQPITPAFLRILRRSLDQSQPRQRLLWESVLLGYFFMLRRSEYLRIGKRYHSYCLKTSNAFFSDARGHAVKLRHASAVTIGLEGAKNDQYGRGAWRTMHASGDRNLCPVIALQHIWRDRAQTRQINSTYVCAGLDATTVAQAYKRVASQIGVPKSVYLTHSIRIFGATALMNGGADHLSIKLLGRWMSNCYERYPTQAASATVGLSLKMHYDDPATRSREPFILGPLTSSRARVINVTLCPNRQDASLESKGF